MAGEMIFLHLHAIIVVVSMSSAIPWASLPITLALAGAIITTSACLCNGNMLYLELKVPVKGLYQTFRSL